MRGLQLDRFKYPIDVDRKSLIPSWTEHFLEKTVYKLIISHRNEEDEFEMVILSISNQKLSAMCQRDTKFHEEVSGRRLRNLAGDKSRVQEIILNQVFI